MPPTLQLVRRLRAQGLAAVVSGAGPSVLVLTTGARAAEVDDLVRGWHVLRPGIDTSGALVTTREGRTGEPGSPALVRVLQ
jgi:homoserine kinase